MRLTACFAAVCVCAAAAGIDADVYEPFVVNVHIQIDRSITSRVIPADLKDETEVLWRPYGVHLEWTDAHAHGAAPSGLSMEVFLEQRILDAPGLPAGGMVLGRTSVKPNVLSPRPIHVSLDATASVLADSRTSVGRIVHDHNLGRALGRVLAHEIGHSLLGTPYHADVGLMRAVFRPDELAEADRTPFRLTCHDVARLRGRLGLTGTEHELIDPETCLPDHAVR